MDFLNKTRDSLMGVGAKFSQKASGVSGAVTLTMKIREEEKNLDNSIAELGRIMVEQHPEEAQRLCPDLFYSIQELAKQIDKDKKDAAICRGMKICPNCGAEQEQDVLHCSVCGMSMEEAEAYLAQNQNISSLCRACGASIPEGSLFCSKCGARVEA